MEVCEVLLLMRRKQGGFTLDVVQGWCYRKSTGSDLSTGTSSIQSKSRERRGWIWAEMALSMMKLCSLLREIVAHVRKMRRHSQGLISAAGEVASHC
jgi:hypothetical protein